MHKQQGDEILPISSAQMCIFIETKYKTLVWFFVSKKCEKKLLSKEKVLWKIKRVPNSHQTENHIPSFR